MKQDFRPLVKYFAADLTPTQGAAMTVVSLRSVNAIFLRMRRKIAAECERQSSMEGVLQLDKLYVAHVACAGGKTIVFGRLKRGDYVYTAS